MVKVKANLTGISPLMLHNGQLADPQNKWSREMKAVSGKRKKTDDDLAEMRRLEWFGGLVLDEKGRPCITGEMLIGAWRDGGRKLKLGKDVVAGVWPECSFPIEYEGPKDMKKLYADERFVDVRGVKVGQSRVMRCRPIFRAWSVTIECEIDPEVIDVDPALQALEVAGARIGLGDFRPRFGRFLVERLA